MKVVVDGEERVCWREYADFVVFAASLKKKFRCASVPPLPPAFHALSSVTDSLLMTRLVGIRLFLNSVMRHPFLRATLATDLFLQPTEVVSKKALDELLDKKGLGQQMWLEYLAVVENPTDPDTFLKEIETEIASLDDFYDSFLKEMKALSSKLNSYASTLKGFNLSLETWRNVERTDLHKLSAVVATESTEPLKEMVASYLQELQGANDANRDRVLEKAEKTLVIMKKPIKYEKMVIESFSADIEKVRSRLSSFNKATQTVDDLTEKKGKAIASESPSNSLEQKLKTACETLREAEAEKYFFVRGLLVVEVSRFRHERGLRSARLLHDLAQLQATVAAKEAEQWLDLAGKIPTMMSSTSSERLLCAVKAD